MRRLFIGFLLLIQAVGLSARVWVYDYPDTLVYTQDLGRNFRSEVFAVTVKQDGQDYPSYVLADYNTFVGGSRQKMTNWNHSTTFSFDGTVVIEVRKKDGSSMSGAEVYPLHHQIPFVLADGGQVLQITLTQPRQLYVALPNMFHHPLFIFADPPEINLPDPSASNVLTITPGMTAAAVKNAIQTTSASIIYFAPGLHQFGPLTDKTYPGYQLPVLSDKTYYLPGGACVIGSFLGQGASNVEIRGRGIISGCGKERLANAESIPFNLIQLNGQGSNQLVEGITMTNPPHFCILSRGQMLTRNVKLFGWWHQTDGWGGENGSQIFDSFMKVNDDYVKLYRANQRVSNLVFYKQINGAAIQLGWNPYGQASNGYVSDIYVVADADKAPGGASNTAIINLKNNGGSTIQNLTFENLYLEASVQRTLGIETDGGSVSNLLIRNVYLSGQNRSFNYLYGHGGGNISGITLQNIQINGQCMENDTDFNLRRQGGVSSVSYQSCSTTELTVNPFAKLQIRVNQDQVSIAHPHTGNWQLSIHDLQGQELLMKKSTMLPISWQAPHAGIYLLRLRNHQGESMSQKIWIRE
ncbi:MAG: hypothetical protein AAF804_01870 [Bacteroidota bacterium]